MHTEFFQGPGQPGSGARRFALAIGIGFVLGAIVIVIMSDQQVGAQSAPAAETRPLSFEVAAVKRSRYGEGTSFRLVPGRLTYRNMVMEMIIEFAYGHDWGEFGFTNLRNDQLEGGPSWVRGEEFGYEGFDIDAKVEDSLAEQFGKDCGRAFFHGKCGYRSAMLAMLQSLLADRFKLKVRWETRMGPVYALVVAKGGPKLSHTKPDAPDSAAAKQNPARRPACPAGFVCLEEYNVPMGQVANWLNNVKIGRPVIDRTGLKGGYDFRIQYVREQAASSNVGADNALPAGVSGPSIFSALQQQLGLKLKPTKGPVEVLVIDHIERPSEN
jgi:uncharacterized protein (TIGR03435 family)